MKISPQTIEFIDHPCTYGTYAQYTSLTVKVDDVLQSWHGSLYAFEWLHPDGKIKTLDDLTMQDREKRLQIERALKNADPIEKPVLGLGMLDTIEIGAGKPALLTLAALGLETMPVHIRNADKDHFQKFIA